MEIYKDPEKLSESEFNSYMSILPEDRKKKVLKFYRRIDQKLSLLAYILLRRGLENYYGISMYEGLKLIYNHNEKPFLADYPDIYFNISHCERVVVCVFSDKPIGVDVESLIIYDEDLLRRIANPQEYNFVVSSSNPSLSLTILWIKKESFLKMNGTGLVDNLHNVINSDFDSNCHFEYNYESGLNYVLGICCCNV